MGVLNWEISDHYPFSEDLFSPENTVQWELLKNSLALETVLTGAVYIKAPFGVFFDAGVGFPVLLEVIHFGKERAAFPEDYPELSSEISGRLVGFAEGNRQLHVVNPTLAQS
ncbi:MAG: hypothetical protein EOO37_01995 [Cytophagaceae bacterium]|nr:MAG: hypothetical protein EOO37_01995 [Cytophagaceae bacterium]